MKNLRKQLIKKIIASKDMQGELLIFMSDFLKELNEDRIRKAKEHDKYMQSLGIKTKGFKFSRYEANER